MNTNFDDLHELIRDNAYQKALSDAMKLFPVDSPEWDKIFKLAIEKMYQTVNK